MRENNLKAPFVPLFIQWLLLENVSVRGRVGEEKKNWIFLKIKHKTFSPERPQNTASKGQIDTEKKNRIESMFIINKNDAYMH